MRKIKTPAGPSLISSISEDIKDKMEYYHELMEDYGDIVRLPMLQRAYLVSSADMIRHILKDNVENYVREGMEFRPLQRVLGRGLLLLKGTEWKKRRKTLAPLFQVKHLGPYVSDILLITERLLHQWETHTHHDKSIDICPDLSGNTYRIALKVFFGQTVEEAALKQIMWAVQMENKYAMAVSAHVPLLPSLAKFRMYRAEKILRPHIQRIVKTGKENPESNLLDVLLNACNTGDQPLTRQEIYDEVKTFLITGHETTATALAWTLYLLAKHPEIQEKAANEIQQTISNQNLTMDLIEKLPYLRAVFEESIRLYPPIWSLARKCMADDYIGDYFIKKGSLIMICPYLLHRRESYWNRPLEFIPERHLIPPEKDRPLYAFIPYGAGPRLCIAHHFATLECLLILTLILQRFRLKPDVNHKVAEERLISLKPAKGIRLFIETR